MTIRWTEEELERFKQRQAETGLPLQDPPRAKARHKYRAEPIVVDGIRFDSQLEARYYRRLLLKRDQGQILGFLRQVPLHLPGRTRLVLDFQVFELDGTSYFVDTKGFETEVFKVKLRQARELYPWADIRIVRKVRGL
jgi:hypothetical protein